MVRPHLQLRTGATTTGFVTETSLESVIDERASVGPPQECPQNNENNNDSDKIMPHLYWPRVFSIIFKNIPQSYTMLVLLIAVLIAIYFWSKCGRDNWLPYAGLSPVWPPRSYPGWRPFPYWRDYIGRNVAEVKRLFDTRYPLSNVIYVNPIEQDVKMITERGANSAKKVIMVIVIGDEVRDIQTNSEI